MNQGNKGIYKIKPIKKALTYFHKSELSYNNIFLQADVI